MKCLLCKGTAKFIEENGAKNVYCSRKCQEISYKLIADDFSVFQMDSSALKGLMMNLDFPAVLTFCNTNQKTRRICNQPDFRERYVKAHVDQVVGVLFENINNLEFINRWAVWSGRKKDKRVSINGNTYILHYTDDMPLIIFYFMNRAFANIPIDTQVISYNGHMIPGGPATYATTIGELGIDLTADPRMDINIL